MIGSVLPGRWCWLCTAPAGGALRMCVGCSQLAVPGPGDAAESDGRLSLQSSTSGASRGPRGRQQGRQGPREGVCERVTREPASPCRLKDGLAEDSSSRHPRRLLRGKWLGKSQSFLFDGRKKFSLSAVVVARWTGCVFGKGAEGGGGRGGTSDARVLKMLPRCGRWNLVIWFCFSQQVSLP